MSQTRDQQRFTISEVAADWHGTAVLCGHPLPALTENWTHGAASRHTVAPVSHTRPSRRSRYLETAGGVLLLLVCLSVCVFVCYIRLYFGKKRYSVMEFSVLTGNGLVW